MGQHPESSLACGNIYIPLYQVRRREPEQVSLRIVCEYGFGKVCMTMGLHPTRRPCTAVFAGDHLPVLEMRWWG